MAAEIFKLPENLEKKVPTFELEEGYDEYKQREEAFYDEVRSFLKDRNFKGKNSGTILSMPIADSSALYMVMKMRPLQLIHLPIMDAWEHPMARLLDAKEVNRMIEFAEKMKSFHS
jgi:hypothetical protein